MIEQLKEYQQTIHQLTHHMKLLQSNGLTNGQNMNTLGYSSSTTGAAGNAPILTTNPKNGQYYQAAPEYTLRASYPPSNSLPTTNFLKPAMTASENNNRPVELEIPPAPWEPTALPTPTNRSTNPVAMTTAPATTGISTRVPTKYY